jgi:transcriptional regulator with XRE-family HTH domain
MVQSAGSRKKPAIKGARLGEARERAARRIRERREELGLTQESLAAAAGVSVSTVKSLENTKALAPPSERTERAVEAALLWAPGSIGQIEFGGEPDPVDPDQIDGSQMQVFRNLAAHFPAKVSDNFAVIAAALDARPRSAIEDALWERLVQLALAEERHVNEVLRDAIDLYERTLGPR